MKLYSHSFGMALAVYFPVLLPTVAHKESRGFTRLLDKALGNPNSQ